MTEKKLPSNSLILLLMDSIWQQKIFLPYFFVSFDLVFVTIMLNMVLFFRNDKYIRMCAHVRIKSAFRVKSFSSCFFFKIQL